MKPSTRTFTDAPAVRERVPLLVGLSGPSGGGKTFSALRLATGIKQVVGGDIFLIDTENGRAKHYAEDFDFRHVPFGEPFGSLDYLAAMQYCVSKGAKVVVVDSGSHEHEGVGGMLDQHETILTRMAGDDFKRREAMKMLAWSEPKQARRQLINGMMQLNCNFIFCFRAKDTAKPRRGANNKMEVVKMGFLPIAGPEWVFEMTLNCLLLPNANGVPTFLGDDLEEGEKMMIKLPKQFKHIFDRPDVQLTEDIGRQLAEWAAGTPKQGGTSRPATNPITAALPSDSIDPSLLDGCKVEQCPKCSLLVGFAKDPSTGKTRAYNKNGDWHVPRCSQPTGWGEPPADDDELDDPFDGDSGSGATAEGGALEMGA
jgi:hypothetical protein